MRIAMDGYRDDFRQLVEYCMKLKGKQRTKCFNCGVRLTNATRQIHHRRYDGATIDDLEYGCHTCNMQPEFRYLT